MGHLGLVHQVVHQSHAFCHHRLVVTAAFVACRGSQQLFAHALLMPGSGVTVVGAALGQVAWAAQEPPLPVGGWGGDRPPA
jgi:hypothetical protein